MRTYKDVAKEVILAYFNDLATQDKLNASGFAELSFIHTDDKVLLEHVKALKNIFENAIAEIENGRSDE